MSSVILTPLCNTKSFQICWVCEVACQFYSVAISANPMLGVHIINLSNIPHSNYSGHLKKSVFFG